MAVSVSLIFGRLGSIVGSNVVGQLIEVNCDATFFFFSGWVLGMFNAYAFIWKTTILIHYVLLQAVLL